MQESLPLENIFVLFVCKEICMSHLKSIPSPFYYSNGISQNLIYFILLLNYRILQCRNCGSKIYLFELDKMN